MLTKLYLENMKGKEHPHNLSIDDRIIIIIIIIIYILCIQTSSEVHPASCAMGTGVLSRW
jgi:hypothetical protein